MDCPNCYSKEIPLQELQELRCPRCGQSLLDASSGASARTSALIGLAITAARQRGSLPEHYDEAVHAAEPVTPGERGSRRLHTSERVALVIRGVMMLIFGLGVAYLTVVDGSFTSTLRNLGEEEPLFVAVALLLALLVTLLIIKLTLGGLFSLVDAVRGEACLMVDRIEWRRCARSPATTGAAHTI